MYKRQISLLASLGMAATIATTIYAYANLLCANPKACKDGEQSAYAAVVAIANGIAHTVAILILGPLEHLVKTQLKAGLALWIVCRAASVLCLVIGGDSPPTTSSYLQIESNTKTLESKLTVLHKTSGTSKRSNCCIRPAL